MSTDVPPHNLREVVSAAIRLLENSRTSLDELLQHVRGPDFPTGGELVSTPEEIRNVYTTGNGTLRLRARWSLKTAPS